ncbi:MAG: class I tRNA ligase family protein [Actinomycetes bacterium]
MTPNPPTNPSTTPPENSPLDSKPRLRYDSQLATSIEAAWQDRWDREHTFWAPNPTGSLRDGFEALKDRRPVYVLDMFPYPSGAGLHVGHPLGYIGTDVYARFQRMTGANVLHAMGYDAFGLPAEQYAVQTGQHPRVTTEANIANMRRQLRALGLGHDSRRGVATTDVDYYRWTQWIFLQIFNSFYDDALDRARPITDLVAEFESGERDAAALTEGVAWADLDDLKRRVLVDSFRLAYVGEAPVNWCPGLGTVLANEEVTADGRSERGNFPVIRRPLKQWMMRITSYADRLISDLDLLDWTDSIKLMQRNWIGKSIGAEVTFGVDLHENLEIKVFTTRPDTLFGATYMVLAPEHELVDSLVPSEWPGSLFDDAHSQIPLAWRGIFGAEVTPPEAVRRYRAFASAKSELERQAEGTVKTGVFTGAFAVNPVNGERIPIFIADYVLAGYGTGAIMAVPAHDDRDFAFAREFDLAITPVVEPDAKWLDENGVTSSDASNWIEAFTGVGVAMASANSEISLNGLDTPSAKAAITAWLEAAGLGYATTTYKLRDWLFSRQRYWGEPFPIVYDETGLPIALPAEQLPVELPEVSDFAPRISEDPEALPEPPLSRAGDWLEVELDLPGPAWAGLGGGPKRYRREVNTMPQWAGSCWYYLRYLDPQNVDALVDAGVERYWMDAVNSDGVHAAGGVDLYVGGVEHAVLHLLYARFWHKVLFDLGHVSTVEPFQRLFNQGYIQAYAFTDERGVYVEASEVVERDGVWYLGDEVVNREYGKMGKSLKNVVTPDDIYNDYGADTLRLYEMFMGPLDASRPWSTTDIVGVHRFLQRLWRNLIDEDTGEVNVSETPADDDSLRLMNRTILAVRSDMESMSFNTAIARLFELNNHLTTVVAANGSAPREIAEGITLMVAPLAPHIAEELWSRLGHPETLTYEPFPVADESLLVVDSVEVPIQVNGKLRSRVTVSVSADAATLEAAARADEKIAELLEGATVRKVIAVPGRLVNFVLG